MAANLSPQDAGQVRDVMLAYAEHDNGTTDENGVLLPR